MFLNMRIIYKILTLLFTFLLIIYQMNNMKIVSKQKLFTDNYNFNNNFTIHILTWNRPHALLRLMNSLTYAQYENETIDLIIHIDGGQNNNDTYNTASQYKWYYGKKEIIKQAKQIGLAKSWFQAWQPMSSIDHAIIFEDDIIVSKLWYIWLKNAWKRYGHRNDLAGITLQRQSFIPQKPFKRKEIINDNKPFLFALVGSIGFSPHPLQWKKFLRWINHIDMKTFDVSLPELITTTWYKKGPSGHMWTQHFIYFCKVNRLYTLYINLPKKMTLAEHWQEKGMHFPKTLGPIHQVAEYVPIDFPIMLNKYSFSGILEPKS